MSVIPLDATFIETAMDTMTSVTTWIQSNSIFSYVIGIALVGLFLSTVFGIFFRSRG